MKTAVSVPDPVFKKAEKLKKKLKVSRSQLYSRALESFVKANLESEVTKRLNEVYAKVDSRLDPAWAQAQSRAIGREDW